MTTIALTGDDRFAVDEKWESELIRDGMSEPNARKLARRAPYRVSWGFGVFVNCATREEARAEADRVAADWNDSICGPRAFNYNAARDWEYRPETLYDKRRGSRRDER